MARPLRVEYPGAIYHVLSRGVNGLPTFHNDEDRRDFLNILGKLVGAGLLIAHAFCLMTNHFHVLCETPFGHLGRWIQRFLGRYTQRFNFRHNRRGHLWQARYKGLIVEDGKYFLECSRYIHLNPFRAGLVRASEDYIWSSRANYLGGLHSAAWVTIDKTLGHFSDRECYRTFIEAGHTANPISPFDQAIGGIVFGSDDFVAKIRDMVEKRQDNKELLGLRSLLRAQLTKNVEPIRRLVSEIFRELPAKQMKKVFILALHRHTWLNNREIADLMQRSPARISQVLAEMEVISRQNPAVEHKIASIADVLAL